MVEFIVNTNSEIRLSKAVFQYNQAISYSHVMSLLRKKDVMLNGKRINSDLLVKKGDLVRLYTTVYTPETYEYNVETVFENDCVLVYWKPKGLETQGEISLQSYARRTYPEAEACHRLDLNTDGLIIVAKTLNVKQVIVRAMNAGQVKKRYITALYGRLPAPVVEKSAFIIKDAERGYSRVVDEEQKGALPIKTLFTELCVCEGFTIAEVLLFTGRTHQIRAQAHAMGNYVLGDGKYCPEKVRRQFKFKKQALTAYKLAFDTDIPELEGLNGSVLVRSCELTEYIK